MSEVDSIDPDRREVRRADGPSLFYDYLILALGTLAVIWFLRRARRRKPVLVVDPRLAQYNEEIEKELQNLDK